MAKEIASNIYLLELPLPFAVNLLQPHAVASVNLYLVQDGQRLLLVDCGVSCAASWQTLQQEFDFLGFKFSQLTDIVITHTHIDHVGLLDQLILLAPQATVHIHRLEFNLLSSQQLSSILVEQQFQTWGHSNGLLTHETAGFAASEANLVSFVTQDLGRCHLIDNNTVIELETQTWEVLWTPGHAPGHLILYNRGEKLLISGDHIFGGSSSSITRFPGSRPDPLADYLDSLEMLDTLDIGHVLPGHGSDFTNLKEIITKVTRQHRRRIERVREIVDSGSKTPYEITQEIWRDGLNPVTYRLALSSTLAYIEWLKTRNELVSQTQNGITYLSR